MSEGDPAHPDEGQGERAPLRDEHPGQEAGTGENRQSDSMRRRPREDRNEQEASEAEQPRRRRHRVRRWTLRSLVTLVVLLGLAALALHIVLQTTVPRELVIQRLQKEFGLRLSAASLETGWGGHTELKHVTLALPLADEAFFEVPRMRVKHTNLLAMLLGFAVEIESVKLDDARLVVKQDSLGRWNVREALALVTRTGGGKSAADDAPRDGGGGSAVQLPEVTLQRATLVLVDNRGRTVTLPSVEFRGWPESPVSWAFSLSGHDRVKVSGRVAPGQRWEHVVHVEEFRGGELLRPWVDLPQPLSIKGDWRGARDGDAVIGRAELGESRVGDVRLSGVVGVDVRDAGATIRPEALVVDVPALEGAPVRLTGGEVRTAGTALESRGLRLALLGGTAKLDGSLDWRTKTGSVNAAWTDLATPGGGAHAGSLEALVQTPWEDRPRINGKLVTRGESRHGSWDAQVELSGAGQSWSRIEWTAEAPRLVVQRGDRKLDLRELLVRLANDGRVMRVAEMRVGQGQHLAGEGEYDFAQKNWWVWVDLRQLAVPGVTRPVELNLAASGSPSRIDVEDLTYVAGKSTVWAKGSYVFAEPKPLDVDLYIWRIPFNLEDPGHRAIARGGLRGEAHATGTIRPIAVDLSGRLIGNDVYFGKRGLGDVRAVITGRAGPERLTLRSERLKLLGGVWELAGQYVYFDGSGSLDIDIEDISLAQVDQLVEPPPDAGGRLRSTIHVSWPRPDRDAIEVTGRWSVRDFRKHSFAAESLDGKLTVQGDELVLSDIQLKHKQGRGTGRVTYNLRDRAKLGVELAAQDWPVELPQQRGSLTVSGNANQAIDIRAKTSTGPVALSASASVYGRDLGTAAVAAEMAGKELRISNLRASAFGGVAAGSGVVNLEDWPLSTGKLECSGIDTGELVEMWPKLEGLRGVISANLDVRRAQERESDEPMLAVLHLRPTGGRYKEIQVGDMDLTLTAGKRRLIVASSALNIAGGQAKAWARLSQQDDVRIGHTQIELEALNVGQVARSFSDSPKASEVNGKLSGELTLFGPLLRGYQVTGEGNLRVTDSGLLNLDILEGVFRLLNPGRPPPPARGRGQVYLRLEQGTLAVVNAFYRNEGIFVRGSGKIQDLFLGGNSAISGQAVGTAKPLSEIKIPFILPQIDDLLATLQENFTSFRIEGTTGAPKLVATTFSEIGRELKNLVVGDVRQEVEGSAGR